MEKKLHQTHIVKILEKNYTNDWIFNNLRSEGVQNVLLTSYVRIIYVLCPGGKSRLTLFCLNISVYLYKDN